MNTGPDHSNGAPNQQAECGLVVRYRHFLWSWVQAFAGTTAKSAPMRLRGNERSMV